MASLILAAGAGRRFGGCKQLAVLDGAPILSYAIDRAEKSQTDETVLVLGCRAAQIEAALDLSGVRIVVTDDWSMGRQASLAAGLKEIYSAASAAVVTLGDEPFVPVEATNRLLEMRRMGQPGLRATYHGLLGHPVLVDRALFQQLIQSGETDAKPATVLREVGVVEVECGDLGAPFDIDRPEDLERISRSASNGESQ